MEILTPSSEQLKEVHGKKGVFLTFRTSNAIISFSKAAMKYFALKPGMLLTFVVDYQRLYFYLSTNENEGFPIIKSNHDCGIVCSRLLIRTLQDRLPSIKRNGPRFDFRVSNTRIKDCITFEILVGNQISKKTAH